MIFYWREESGAQGAGGREETLVMSVSRDILNDMTMRRKTRVTPAGGETLESQVHKSTIAVRQAFEPTTRSEAKKSNGDSSGNLPRPNHQGGLFSRRISNTRSMEKRRHRSLRSNGRKPKPTVPNIVRVPTVARTLVNAKVEGRISKNPKHGKQTVFLQGSQIFYSKKQSKQSKAKNNNLKLKPKKPKKTVSFDTVA